jgi:hypothetical protein
LAGFAHRGARLIDPNMKAVIGTVSSASMWELRRRRVP